MQITRSQHQKQLIENDLALKAMLEKRWNREEGMGPVIMIYDEGQGIKRQGLMKGETVTSSPEHTLRFH